MRKRVVVFVLVSIVAAAWFVRRVIAPGTRSRAPRSEAPIEKAGPRPDIFIITVDTLRADHLSAYGYERKTSPSIDRLAGESILFTNAIAPIPSTGPSIASMWTSRYPYRIGVLRNYYRLHDDEETLAEILHRRASYETAAFVSNYVLIRELSNLHQGFEFYDDFVADREPNRDVYERRAAATVDLAITWLRRPRKRPLFFWLHLMDPHGPYRPPPPFDERFRGGPSFSVKRGKIPDYQFLGPLDRAFYVNRYDGEIAYCDREIGRFIDALRDFGLYDKALVIFHSDHGESLGEHGFYFRHGQEIFEASLRIPLLLKRPRSEKNGGSRENGSPTPARSDRLVSVMDIAPTVLEAAGLPIPRAYEGRSLFRILKAKDPAGREIFVQSDGLLTEGKRRLGIRSAGKKVFYRVWGEDLSVIERHYYALARDPGEKSNRYGALDPEGASLDRMLRSRIDAAASFRLPFTPKQVKPKDRDAFFAKHKRRRLKELDPWHREALRALGYVD